MTPASFSFYPLRILPRSEAAFRSMSDRQSILGTSPLRKEGRAKVLGAAQYIDDLALPGMWHGATVRSRIARGRIRAIRFGDGIPWDEFAIVRASDIPGEN